MLAVACVFAAAFAPAPLTSRRSGSQQLAAPAMMSLDRRAVFAGAFAAIAVQPAEVFARDVEGAMATKNKPAAGTKPAAKPTATKPAAKPASTKSKPVDPKVAKRQADAERKNLIAKNKVANKQNNAKREQEKVAAKKSSEKLRKEAEAKKRTADREAKRQRVVKKQEVKKAAKQARKKKGKGGGLLGGLFNLAALGAVGVGALAVLDGPAEA